ncbi:diguanylate cyclase, partial [Halomonas sp. SUBG004]
MASRLDSGPVLPTTQAQLPLSGFIYKLLGIWFVLALLMMPLLWWLLARILKPLDHLESQIGEVGKGERASLDLATSMQELQQVAMTFNRVEHERQQLVGHLQERQAFGFRIERYTPRACSLPILAARSLYMNPALLEMLDIPPDTPMEAWMERCTLTTEKGRGTCGFTA